jgi:hypothetical protein
MGDRMKWWLHAGAVLALAFLANLGYLPDPESRPRYLPTAALCWLAVLAWPTWRRKPDRLERFLSRLDEYELSPFEARLFKEIVRWEMKRDD